MSEDLTDRLDQILPRITEKGFLSNEGIGNEIACYIFDYAAEDELKVRSHVSWLAKRLQSHHQDLNVLHFNLLDVVVGYLQKRGLFEKTLKMEKTKGDAAVLKMLQGPLAAEKIRDAIAADHNPSDYDLSLVSGVGSVWPALRAHSLLSSLHAVMGQTPLVMFYPGRFDGTTLRLFDQISTHTHTGGGNNYYRAFSLIPRGPQP
jgi:hypothetical protein